MRIILASKSPRRKELLSLITKNFDVIVSDGDESVDTTLSPIEQVKEISRKKAKNVSEKIHEDSIIIGSDTIVVVDDKILGKPKDKNDAIAMLKSISDRVHMVMTAVSIIVKKDGVEEIYTDCDVTKVHVKHLSDEEIECWLNTGNAYDKAGAYGIQQEFGIHIDRIEGSFASVMGLPVHLVYDAIKNTYKEE